MSEAKYFIVSYPSFLVAEPQTAMEASYVILGLEACGGFMQVMSQTDNDSADWGAITGQITARLAELSKLWEAPMAELIESKEKELAEIEKEFPSAPSPINKELN
jgi:hypothetical protein